MLDVVVVVVVLLLGDEEEGGGGEGDGEGWAMVLVAARLVLEGSVDMAQKDL